MKTKRDWWELGFRAGRAFQINNPKKELK